MNFSQYFRADYIGMFVAMSILLVLEMLGVFGHKYVTITAIVRAYMPMWVRAMVWGWLGLHFIFKSPS